MARDSTVKRERRSVDAARSEMTQRSPEQTQWHGVAQTTDRLLARSVDERMSEPERDPSAASRAHAPYLAQLAGRDERRAALAALAGAGTYASWVGP